MIDLGSLATVEQAVNHAGNQSIAPFGSFQQHRSAIRGALPLVEFQHHRLIEKLGKTTNALLCYSRSSEGPFLSYKHCLINMFVAEMTTGIYTTFWNARCRNVLQN
jgi:hypothetical protein